MQVAEFLQDESTQLTASLQLATALRTHIRCAGFDASTALCPVGAAIHSQSSPQIFFYTSRGIQCLDHLATTPPQQASNAELQQVLTFMSPLSGALLMSVMSHLHVLEQLHAVKAASAADASAAASAAHHDEHEQHAREGLFSRDSFHETQEVLLARPQLNMSPLSPRSDVIRFSSPGIVWRNCVGSLLQTLSSSEAPASSHTTATTATDCSPPTGLRSLAICELDYALMARLHHLLRVTQVQQHLQSLDVSHVNTRPQFLRSIAEATALTSLRISHIWGLGSADDLQYSLCRLSELRVLHLHCVCSHSNNVVRTQPEASTVSQSAMQASLSRLTEVKLACNDQTTCHSLYLPVFDALPLATLKQLAVGFNVAKTGRLTDAINLWPDDSHITHLESCTVWLHTLVGQSSSLFERLVSWRCESVQKWEESWPDDSTFPFPGALPNASWALMQHMSSLRELELSGLSCSEQKHALSNLSLCSSLSLRSLRLLHCAGSEGLSEFLACPHVSLTALCVSAHTLSEWSFREQSALWAGLPRHSHLAELIWDVAVHPRDSLLKEQADAQSSKQVLLSQLQHLTGLTKLVLCSIEALGGTEGCSETTTRSLLALPHLRVLACDVGQNLQRSLGGAQTGCGDVASDIACYSSYGVAPKLPLAAPCGSSMQMQQLEQLQLCISHRCSLDDVVSLLCSPGLTTRLCLLSLSNICPDYQVMSAPNALTRLLEVIGKTTSLEELHLHAAPLENKQYPRSDTETLGAVYRDSDSDSALAQRCGPQPLQLPKYLRNLVRLQALVVKGLGDPVDVEEIVRLGLPLQRGVVVM